jgi:hypothetical protein
VLDLPNIKKQLGKDDSVPLSDVEFWSSDVQIALKMGYLTATGDVIQFPDADGEVERVIKLVNKHKTPLNLPGRTDSISAGAQFTLRESELQNMDIRSAIAKGIIGVISSVDVANEEEEGFIKLGEAPSVPTEAPVPDISQPPSEEFLKNLSPAQRSLLLAAQKAKETTAEKPPKLDTNEEISAPTKIVEPNRIIDTENPPPIETSDIPDALGKSVIFNPTGAKPLRIMKNASVTIPKTNRGIAFVDQEQTQERIEQHPTLKPQEQAEDLELLNLEDVGRRRNPNLPIIGEDDNEVEPIE